VTEQHHLFLVQARSNLAVFELLRSKSSLPHCHALHYLQMATEMLGKALAWKHGPPGDKSHRAFVSFLRSLSTNRQAQNQLGFQGKNENWKHLIRKSVPLAQAIEDLAPSLCKDGANPEYPWPFASPTKTPAEHVFEIWSVLQSTAGLHFLWLISRLFAVAEVYL
jgi:hypothetical protein